MKKHWHIWVGTGAILLAVLTVLGVIFLPRLAAKSDMKELLLLAAAPEAQYVRLVDPAFKHEGILAGEGRELELTGELLDSTRAALSALAEDFSYKGKGSALAGAFGLHLLIKTAEGEILKLYLNETDFYAELKGGICLFTPDDTQSYAALYSTLQAAFSSNFGG